MKNSKTYRGFRYPVEIISHVVWLYFRFALSFRDIEELVASRGIIGLCRVVDRKNEMPSERYSALKLDGPVLPAHKIDRRTTSYLCHRS